MRIAFTLVALACAATATAAATPTRTGDLGRFVVTRAVINPALDAAQRQYRKDDPRLVGRYIEIAPQRLAFDGTSPCTRVVRARRRGTVADLLRADLPPRSPARQRPLGLAEKELGPEAQAVDIVQYRCATPDTGQVGGSPGRSWTGASSFPLGAGRRGLFWATEAVLVLAPASNATAPRPGFECRRARAASETAICRDPSLASWDRSVATAYTLLRDGGGPDGVEPVDDRGALAESQRRFLADRDRCGADRACLEGRMAERVEALMRRQYDVDATKRQPDPAADVDSRPPQLNRRGKRRSEDANFTLAAPKSSSARQAR